MVLVSSRLRKAAAAVFISCGLFGALAPLRAQGPKIADALPGLDMKGLTAEQRATIYKLVSNYQCPCGCGMKVSECRVQDPNCFYSRGLAGTIAEAIRAGKSEAEAVKAAEASKYAHLPPSDNKILSDAIELPTAGAPVTGPKQAPISIVEFSDFQCPYCIMAAPQLQSLMKDFPTQINLAFKQFPLEMHSEAALAAQAAIAAGMQGKFWPMHDALFAQRGKLSRVVILAIADQLKLDPKRFATDLDSPQAQETMTRDMDDGYRAGVMGTPTIFINGQRFNGPLREDVLKPIIEEQLKLVAQRPVAAAARK